MQVWPNGAESEKESLEIGTMDKVCSFIICVGTVALMVVWLVVAFMQALGRAG